MKYIFDKQDRLVLIGIAFYFIALVTIAINTNGTCDSGDSIAHFLFSKYAFQHPENFLNHWAKPLFVLFSVPFAQFGFVGIKIFNCSLAALTIWVTYQIAKKLNYKNAWLAAVFLCFTPGYITHIFSGLTEPMFALVMILGIYYLLSDRIYLALCIISFLPFVRSEGLIIVGVFAFYLITNKQYRYLPWLIVGHIVYSLAGVVYYNDILWVFTKIPYAGSSGKYGSGNIKHFIVQLNYIIGIPLYMLLGLGFIKKIRLFVSKKTIDFTAETILIYASFIAFFTAHTLFWYYGIFESMGLSRVLVSIIPLVAIIALNGLNFISEFIKQKLIGRVVTVVFTGFVIAFPFIPNPASVNWKKDFSLSSDEVLIADASQYIQANFPENITMYYTHPYFSVVMNRDPFDKKHNNDLIKFTTEKRSEHYLVVWDNWFSVIENGVSLEQLKADNKLKLLKTYQKIIDGKSNEVVVFEGK